MADCGCIELMNEALEPEGLDLNHSWGLNGKDRRIALDVLRKDRSNRRVKLTVYAAYCPGCGRKYDADEALEGGAE